MNVGIESKQKWETLDGILKLLQERNDTKVVNGSHSGFTCLDSNSSCSFYRSANISIGSTRRRSPG